MYPRSRPWACARQVVLYDTLSFPEGVGRCSRRPEGAARRGQARYIVWPAVNKTRQCRGVSTVCTRVCVRACVCVCAWPGLTRGKRERGPRAFICLLAGPRINNAAIRTREERVKGGAPGEEGAPGEIGRVNCHTLSPF